MVDDLAPFHFDKGFAQKHGFPDRIVHGFLISSFFSGILGQNLPGPSSVINQTSFKYHLPVFIGQRIIYSVSVEKITDAVKAVSLSLKATNNSDNIVINGSAICSFPKIKNG